VLLPVILCFWQAFSDPIRPAEQIKLQTETRTAAFDQAKAQEKELRKKAFEKDFNELVNAIKNFSEAYNQSAGSAWPSDKARALSRAMHKLEHDKELIAAKE
jgi:hypothetical protein